MTPDEAIAKLDEQQCPMGCGATGPEVEYDDERTVAFELCKNAHVWPYHKFSDEPSTNSFIGEFDPKTIEEKLEEYSI